MVRGANALSDGGTGVHGEDTGLLPRSPGEIVAACQLIVNTANVRGFPLFFLFWRLPLALKLFSKSKGFEV